MLRTFMRSKIHRALVTEADPDYMGSITLDPLLIEAAGLLNNEQVDIYNVSNGNRLTTYVLAGRRGSGQVCLNGAAALLCTPGDRVLIVAYAQMDEREAMLARSRTLLLGLKNRVRKVIVRSNAALPARKGR